MKEKAFQSFCLISQQVQKIESTVKTTPITPTLRQKLHKELETSQDFLEILITTQEHNNNQFSQLTDLQRQIITLYRLIEEQFECNNNFFITKETQFTMELYEVMDLLYREKKQEAFSKLHPLRPYLSKVYNQKLDAKKYSTDALISVLLEIADKSNVEFSSSASIHCLSHDIKTAANN